MYGESKLKDVDCAAESVRTTMTPVQVRTLRPAVKFGARRSWRGNVRCEQAPVDGVYDERAQNIVCPS